MFGLGMMNKYMKKEYKISWNELDLLREFYWKNSDKFKKYIEKEGYDYVMTNIIQDNIFNWIEELWSIEMKKKNRITHQEAKKGLKKFIFENEDGLNDGGYF
jgi:hypothetical protein